LIVNCVSVAIAFIPEGLPIAITAGLTITANLMKKNQILVVNLSGRGDKDVQQIAKMRGITL